MRARRLALTLVSFVIAAAPVTPWASVFTAAPAHAATAACTIRGTARSDVIHGTPHADVICGFGGNDVIYGGGGDDIIRGGAGNDRIYSGAGKDNLNGGPGNDTLNGGTGPDDLYGSAGSDLLHGGPGIDSLYGGAGADHLDGGTGVDDDFGNAGADACAWDLADVQYVSCVYDRARPVIHWATVSTPHVDVTNSAAIVVIRARLSDDTAVSSHTNWPPYAFLYNPVTQERAVDTGDPSLSQIDLVLVSGTVHDGTWQGRARVTKGSPATSLDLEIVVSDPVLHLTDASWPNSVQVSDDAPMTAAAD